MIDDKSIKSNLRLRAHDTDDLAVLSSLFQDAIIPGSDMHIDKSKQTLCGGC